MRVYVDSSALLKRVITEAESLGIVETLERHHRDGDMLVSSSLAWVEVARALRTHTERGLTAVAADVDGALSGIAEQRISREVISLARRVNPHRLRSLDAIHLASALLIDADEMLTYDDRLAAACAESGLAVSRPA